jgi:hypothetical protein
MNARDRLAFRRRHNMTAAKDDLIDALRLRYDHYSALSVFELARERANLADKPAYEAAELRALRDALSKVGDRVQKVLARVDELLEDDADPKASRAKAKAESVADKPADKLAEKPANKVVEKPADKPADKVADKPADKVADKTADKVADKTADKPLDKPASIETTIVLRGVDAKEGDQVLVCGNGTALGDWDPALARPMVCAGDEWRVAVQIDARSPLAFKFLRRTPDGEVTWEGGDNREVPAAERIEATWR